MLHEFLTKHRAELIARCSAKVAKRTAPLAITPGQQYGIPVFLDQLIETLRLEQTASAPDKNKVSGPPEPAPSPVPSDIGKTAAKHGNELLRQGLTVDQVVHDYGDLCQAVTELAVEISEPVRVAEFHTLNRCLDNAIADAVTEFARRRDSQNLRAAGERVRNVAHEMRNALDAATLALNTVRHEKVLTDATGDALDRRFSELRSIVEGPLTEVPLTDMTQLDGPDPGPSLPQKLRSLAAHTGIVLNHERLKNVLQGVREHRGQKETKAITLAVRIDIASRTTMQDAASKVREIADLLDAAADKPNRMQPS